MHANVQSIALLLATHAALISGSPAADSSLATTNINTLFSRDNGCAAAGAVNGQCGRYYSGDGCQDGDLIATIKPDCSKACTSVPNGFKSIKATGDGTYGTNCYVFENDNCDDSGALGQTTNGVVSWDQPCKSTDGSDATQGKIFKSFLCTFKC